MTVTATMSWMILMAVAIVTILTVGTLGAADLLRPGRKREQAVVVDPEPASSRPGNRRDAA